MPRDRTPIYVVKLFVPGYSYSPMEWRVNRRGKIPGSGRPTNDNLATYVREFEEDCLTGVNQHLGPQTVRRATITNQETGNLVATYIQPRFE